MKSLITTLTISMAFVTASTMVQANDSTVVDASNAAELSKVFDTTQLENVQALELSNQEMKETQGAVLPFVAAALMGGAFGAWSNHGMSYYNTGNFASLNSTLWATGGGAIGGGYSNLMLRGAGIATSPFVSSAWRGTTGYTNVFIRGNGAAIGYSNAGIYKNR